MAGRWRIRPAIMYIIEILTERMYRMNRILSVLIIEAGCGKASYSFTDPRDGKTYRTAVREAAL